MLLSAVSVLVVAQSSSDIPEGLTNNPVFPVTAAQCTVFRGVQAPAFLDRVVSVSVRKTDCKKMVYCIARKENQILKVLEFV